MQITIDTARRAIIAAEDDYGAAIPPERLTWIYGEAHTVGLVLKRGADTVRPADGEAYVLAVGDDWDLSTTPLAVGEAVASGGSVTFSRFSTRTDTMREYTDGERARPAWLYLYRRVPPMSAVECLCVALCSAQGAVYDDGTPPDEEARTTYTKAEIDALLQGIDPEAVMALLAKVDALDSVAVRHISSLAADIPDGTVFLWDGEDGDLQADHIYRVDAPPGGGVTYIDITPAEDAVARSGVAANAAAISVLQTSTATLQLDSAPTTSTVGAFGQHAIDTTTGKEYTCTAVTVDNTDPQNPVTTYTWVDDINEKGGTLSGTLLYTTGTWTTGINQYSLQAGAALSTVKNGSIQVGYHTRGTRNYQIVGGEYNTNEAGLLIIGNGDSSNISGSNALLLTSRGDLYIAGGHQQGITAIPAATTAYTLAEGQQSHIPSSASTYILPAVADATRTHECILTVRFSASVLTYAFEDSDGNAITPLPLSGTIADGSVVCFRCTWEALLNQWVIMPVMLGTYEEVTP